MSREAVASIQAVYECMARGDFRASAELVAPEFEWEQHQGVVEPGSHRGDGVQRALDSIFEVYEDFRVEAEEYIDLGEKVLVVARIHGRARSSGMQLGEEFAFIWSMKDGRPVRMEQYPARRAALEAVAPPPASPGG